MYERDSAPVKYLDLDIGTVFIFIERSSLIDIARNLLLK